MRIKLILFVLFLISMLIVANWVAGQYLASVVDRQLQQISASDEQLNYRYQNLKINPALGSIKIFDLDYSDQNVNMEADKIRGSLTWADLLRILRSGTDNPLSGIHSLRITATGLTIRSANLESNHPVDSVANNPGRIPVNHPYIRIKSLNVSYNGRMDELLNLPKSNHVPYHNHRFNVVMSQVFTNNGYLQDPDMLPVLSGFLMPESIDRISLQVRYQADKQTAQLSSLRINSRDFAFRAGGDISYTDGGWPGSPESYALYYRLNARTHDIARIRLPGILGGFSMDTLSVNSRLNFGQESAGLHPLSLPGETSINLGNIHWYPSTELTERFGIVFGMFGLSEKQLPVQSLHASYHISQDTLRINEAILATEPFDARIQMLMATPLNQRSDIQSGSVVFIRTGSDFDQFVEGLENLFQIEFPRKDGLLYFEFSGDPESPRFNFNI